MNLRPVIKTPNKTIQLLRVEFSDNERKENWLQELLFENPSLIPFEELDPLFRDSIPLAREVQIFDANKLDILYVNNDGLLTLVETKLWRNPEARRAVVAQLINYAASLSKMSYQDLGLAVSAARKEEGKSLFDIVRDQIPQANEQRFHDSVHSNLKAGRFLLLIVGDGIREDVEEMCEYLHRPGMGFTLRLVEMGTYRLPDAPESLIVIPQLIARTREINRTVVEVRGGQISVEPIPESVTKASVGRYKITPERFFNELALVVDDRTLDSVRWVLSQAESHDLQLDWMQSGPVFKYYHEGTDVSFTLGQFNRYGDLSELSRFSNRFEELGLLDELWRDYFADIVKLIPGSKIKHFKSKAGNEWDDIDYDDVSAETTLPLLLQDRGAWLAAVDSAILKLKDALRIRKA